MYPLLLLALRISLLDSSTEDSGNNYTKKRVGVFSSSDSDSEPEDKIPPSKKAQPSSEPKEAIEFIKVNNLG